MRKKVDLSDFERSMVIHARCAGLSSSETADLPIQTCVMFTKYA